MKKTSLIKNHLNSANLRAFLYAIFPLLFGFLLIGKLSNIQTLAPENLALGNANTAFYASVDGKRIHFSTLTDYLNTPHHASEHNTILWLGNSQLHAINGFKVGDENAPAILYKQLISEGNKLLVFSQPNANLQEQYVLFEYLNLHLNIECLILPLVFDDFRETGIRSDIAETALQNSLTIKKILSNDLGQRLYKKYAPRSQPELAGIKGTLQEEIEQSITTWLSKNWGLWAARPKVRAILFDALYRFRNAVFNITPSTKRLVIPARYTDNMTALKSILQYEKKGQIKILVYIAPIRDDIDIPYDLDEYRNFKKEVRELTAHPNIHFVNFENIVPSNYWGLKPSTSLDNQGEIDFMHFQAKGHEILADTLFTELETFLKSSINR